MHCSMSRKKISINNTVLYSNLGDIPFTLNVYGIQNANLSPLIFEDKAYYLSMGIKEMG
jgi:hypothetical protein